MANGITGIDHALIGVRDLEAARDRFRRLGFTVTPRGSHIGWGTANYCIMFPGDYLELLGIADPGKFVNNLDKTLAERGEGLTGLALATRDAGAAAAALKQNGLKPQDPSPLARNLELPGGTVRPEFTLVHLPPEVTPGLRLFLCQHRTPELLRQPDWLLHPNGARAIASIAVVVERPEALIAPYEALFGAGSTAMTDDTLAVFTGNAAILFVTESDLEVLYPGIPLGSPPPAPWIAALNLVTKDPDRAAAGLSAAGVPFHRHSEDSLQVAPAEACGMLLSFSRFRGINL